PRTDPKSMPTGARVGKFFTLLPSVSLLFEEPRSLFDECGSIQDRLRPELAKRRGIESFPLLRRDQDEPRVLGFDCLEQTLLVDRLELRQHQQTKIFALGESGKLGP